MPATHLSLNVHLVFRTKDSAPVINDEIIADTHAYIGGISKTLGDIPLQVGGVADHVHILLGIKATHSVANLVQEIKKHSSPWLQERVPGFTWQEGYGAFSVSPERVPGVVKYIQNQSEHHKTMTFEEERIMLLKLARMEFDPDKLD